MPDKRLIDANALDVIRFTPTGGDLLDAIERGWNECISFLQKKAKTIDAVEVVRCRECRNSQKLKTCADQVYCMVWKSNPRTDGYCYLGAKMDG